MALPDRTTWFETVIRILLQQDRSQSGSIEMLTDIRRSSGIVSYFVVRLLLTQFRVGLMLGVLLRHELKVMLLSADELFSIRYFKLL
jgi:hypothetical protein